MKGSSFSCWQEARNIEDVRDEIDDDEDDLTEEECRAFEEGKAAGRAEERARVRALLEGFRQRYADGGMPATGHAFESAIVALDEVKP